MLTISNISKQFPATNEPILRNISFTVNAGERMGLIGPNGAGKTTLLRIILWQITPDSGSIMRNPPDLRIGYLAQGLELPEETPIQEVLFPELKALAEAEAEIERLAVELATALDDAVMDAYTDALERVQNYSALIDLPAAQELLAQLAIPFPLETPIKELSGGEKTRLGLVALLLHKPQLLILDEPTNHLDITGIEWLENWLMGFGGGALIVSHDRTFLDEAVNRIVALDARTHTAQVYEGNYSEYAAAVHSAIDKQWVRWRDQEVETVRLKADANQTMMWAVQAGMMGNRMAKRARAKEKRLENYLSAAERVEKPAQGWSLKLDFDTLPVSGQAVISTQNLTIGYHADQLLAKVPDLGVRVGERIALVGPNGQGKSTLIKTLLGHMPPLTGQVYIGSSVKIGYLAQEQEILDQNSSALEVLQDAVPTLKQTEARAFLHQFLFAGDDALRPIERLSFGERARLMLALLVARGANVLVLDEPINHLDVPSREQFEQAMTAFRGSVIAVVHDRYFVTRFATTIWKIQDGSLMVDYQ